MQHSRRPWLPFSQADSSGSVSDPAESLGGLGGLLRLTRAMAGRSTMAQKLRFYDHFLSYLRCICLYLSHQKGWYQRWQNAERPPTEEVDPRQYHAFLQLLVALRVAAVSDAGVLLLSPYADLSARNLELLRAAFDKKQPSGKLSSTPFQRLLDSIFIMENLLAVYRGERPRKIRPEVAPWLPLLKEGQLDYEIRLLETLTHLRSLTLENKIDSPFPDTFFTRSGERAFRQFTRERFLAIIDDMEAQGLLTRRVLDVGCGYGDYLEAMLSRGENCELTGLELQEEIAEQTRERFADRANVTIREANVLDYSSTDPYNLVLLNYVLFYFSPRELAQLLDHLEELVSPGGYLLVCQYFPGIEVLKRDLSRQLQDYSLAQRVEMYYGNKILYANTLWNEAVRPFAQGLLWNNWMDLLAEKGWEVAFLGPADRFYYSLFLGIRRRESKR